MRPLEHVHLWAQTEGSVLLVPAPAQPAPHVLPRGHLCPHTQPVSSSLAAPRGSCLMPRPQRNVQGEVSGRLQSQVTENRLTAQTTAYPGLLETGAGHCRRAL